LIVSCSGTLGRVAVVPPNVKPGIINQALLRIRPKSNLVSSRFLKMLLETPDLQSRLFGSAGRSAIKNVKPLSDIRHVKFHLPPLEEQKRIAEILDQAEELRTKRRKAIAQFDTLPQAIFIEMFGNNAPLESGWDTVSFGNLMEVLSDYHAYGSYEILRDNVVLKNQIDHALMIRTTDLENNNATITSNSGYTNRRMVGRCNITHDRGTTETLAGFSQAD
jgi:restriction endonuclease S subunit